MTTACPTCTHKIVAPARICHWCGYSLDARDATRRAYGLDANGFLPPALPKGAVVEALDRVLDGETLDEWRRRREAC